jgi:hypothetical protein
VCGSFGYRHNICVGVESSPDTNYNERWDQPLNGPVLATKDTGIILVPAGAVRPAVVCSRHYIASHRGARRGVATTEVGEEAWPPSPRGTDRGKCQYRGEGGERVSDRCPSSRVPYGWGITLPFIGQEEGDLQACRIISLRIAVWRAVPWS